ncbi:MAG TPA: sugar transferase [Streptosporangiaceae bacterium]|nr:sugar transferase [Streptosporangiaceae bacterium]
MSGHAAVTSTSERTKLQTSLAAIGSGPWTARYLIMAGAADGCCGLAAGLLAYQVRFGASGHHPAAYVALSLTLPLIWLLTLVFAGAYDSRFIGVGTDEFRRVLNAGAFLVAAVAILSYASKIDLARAYVAIALPSVTLFDLLARYAIRKQLHRARSHGNCMRKVVVVGHAAVVADIVTVLRRQTYHGLSVVAACVADTVPPGLLDDVPVTPGLEGVADVVSQYDADTVAVLACPEMAGARLRDLAWDLEKSGTELCVAPALLDVAGPRTTIRPTAGLPLLYMDHPEFSGARLIIKSVFDKVFALVALIAAAPTFAVIALAIKVDDGGPVLFKQTRVGKGGRAFCVYKFRTMVPDAEALKASLARQNQQEWPLFKIRRDPRMTRLGAWLRRWSLDELPQFLNVLAGEMSLVGPRPALPEEAAMYGDHVRRRLAVKPGMTGLWQVNGRSELSWDESVRLDLRYVENWSLMLDLQILWKTWAAVVRGWGAY